MWPRSRRSRGSTVMSDVNQLNTSPLSGNPGEPVYSEPDEGADLPEKAEPVSGEANIASVPTNVPGMGSVVEIGSNIVDRTEPSAKAEPLKKFGDEDRANDQGVQEVKAKVTASKRSPIWDKYIRMAEAEDKDILEDWEGAIDITLVFAALFSAISTGFVLESSKNLQPNPAVTTVSAIRELTGVVQAGLAARVNGFSAPLEGASLENTFKPSITTVWVNCLWFFSLGLSISVSLFAMLAKRWCYKARSRHSGTSYERAMRRQKAWDELQKWELELFIEQLATAMHVALITFFIGLVLYLSEINQAATIVTAIPIGLTILSYGALTVLPTWSPAFPMVTPFTRILRGGSSYISQMWSSAPEFSNLFHKEKLISVIHDAGPAIIRSITVIRSLGNKIDTPVARLTSSPKEWLISGCSRPVGTTMPYTHDTRDEQRGTLRALLWLLCNSNDKTLIEEVLEYIGNFPEVIIDSFASGQELLNATTVIVQHLERLKQDAVEVHDIKTTPFSAKCGRFMYLNARPWFHHSSHGTKTGDACTFFSCAYSDESLEEIQSQMNDMTKQPFTAGPGGTLWLEQQAIKIVLRCEPETGFRMCRELYKHVTSVVPLENDKTGETYPTLAWILLNLTVDTTSGYPAFWPAHRTLTNTAPSEDGGDPIPTARPDSVLTLSYFRHSDERNAASKWLQVVGLSGVLNIPTYYLSDEDEVEPDIPANEGFYASMAKVLRIIITPASQLPSAEEGEGSEYIGKLPVYWESQVRLYEFDSLKYCYDALDRAAAYPRFGALCDELEEMKNLIPESRRHRPALGPSKSNLDVGGDPVPDLPRTSTGGPGDGMV